MVDVGDLFICVVTGLAMPLAMLDGFRAVAGESIPRQSTGLQLERRLLVWTLAILLGPGLFVDRMLSAWRDGELSPIDQMNAFVIALGWSSIYGYVVLGFSSVFLPT